jgi:hypothetical protein
VHARGSHCAAAARQARCESAVRGYAGAIYRHTVWKLQLELLLSVPLGRNFSGAQASRLRLSRNTKQGAGAPYEWPCSKG